MKVNSFGRAESLLLLFFLLAQGCDTPTAGNKMTSFNEAELSGPDTIQVPYNQAVQIGETGLSLHFDTLFRDSRCPEDVNCIWEGAWEIGMKLLEQNTTHTLKLGTYLEANMDTTLAGCTIQVLDLLPRPNTTIRHLKSDYRAIVVIRRAD